MATKELVTKVWIEEGCIVCDACETTAPTVFEVLEDTCIIRPAAMDPNFTKPITDDIIDAAEECPVDVIKFDTVTEEVPDEEAAPADEAKEEAPAAAAAKAESPAEKEPAPAKEENAPEKAPAKAAPAAAKASVAGAPDPAIAALLKAATARGGSAGMQRSADAVPESIEAMRGKDLDDLPPDARQARVLEAAKRAKSDPSMSRRSFASGGALVVGWASVGFATGTSTLAFARFMAPNVLEEPDPRVRVGKLAKYVEMAPGDVNEDYKPQGIWMVRLETRVVALNIICTHLGCIPNWLPNDRKFKCPCHGSGYKYDGINFEGPTPRPLERFKLFVEDGIVVVDKSTNYQAELGEWDRPGSFIEV